MSNEESATHEIKSVKDSLPYDQQASSVNHHSQVIIYSILVYCKLFQ